jgi:8-oxo-dGDP phosphatase
VTATGYEVLERTERFSNKVFTFVSDEVRMPDGDVAARDYLRHVGAVAAVAVDSRDQVLLVHQYRHPVGARLWELPAGLTDVAGEAPVDTARRELAEETDLTAARWDLLVDLHPSPGCSSELIRVYLARGIGEVVAGHRHRREHEEADMVTAWVPLDEAVRRVLTGGITNATAVAGILAATRCRDAGWTGLRPAG